MRLEGYITGLCLNLLILQVYNMESQAFNDSDVFLGARQPKGAMGDPPGELGETDTGALKTRTQKNTVTKQPARRTQRRK